MRAMEPLREPPSAAERGCYGCAFQSEPSRSEIAEGRDGGLVSPSHHPAGRRPRLHGQGGPFERVGEAGECGCRSGVMRALKGGRGARLVSAEPSLLRSGSSSPRRYAAAAESCAFEGGDGDEGMVVGGIRTHSDRFRVGLGLGSCVCVSCV